MLNHCSVLSVCGVFLLLNSLVTKIAVMFLCSEGGTQEERKEMFYFTTHSTHFIYGYMVSDIWLRTILIVSEETCCRHIGYSFRLTARVLLYAPSQRQDSTYHGLCYTSRGKLASEHRVRFAHNAKARRKQNDKPTFFLKSCALCCLYQRFSSIIKIFFIRNWYLCFYQPLTAPSPLTKESPYADEFNNKKEIPKFCYAIILLFTHILFF